MCNAKNRQIYRDRTQIEGQISLVAQWWRIRLPRGLDPWVGKIPWRRQWQSMPVFLPGESHRQRSEQATVHGVVKSRRHLQRQKIDYWLPGYRGGRQHTGIKRFWYWSHCEYGWPSNNMNLNCKGPLTCEFFSVANTAVLHDPWLNSWMWK